MLSSSTSSISNKETPETPFQIPSSFFGNQDDMFVHQDLATQDHFFPSVAIGNVSDFPPFDNINQDNLKHDHKNNVVGLDGSIPFICDPLLINLLRPRWKKPDAVVNKHRHRKIVTAQGSRDRRVRLSIQIARQFFDLQDNLGFDKASETIDWLLTQSKSAIEEIAKIKQSRCTVAANEQEKDIEAAEIGDSYKRNSSVSSSSTGSDAKEIGISMEQQHSSFLVKELRAKARERARERTKAKTSFKKLIELKKLISDFRPIIPNSWNQFSRSSEIMSHSVEESILTTQKVNALQNFTTNQQNFMSSGQVPSSTTITENWEISNNISRESPMAGYGSYVYEY